MEVGPSHDRRMVTRRDAATPPSPAALAFGTAGHEARTKDGGERVPREGSQPPGHGHEHVVPERWATQDSRQQLEAARLGLLARAVRIGLGLHAAGFLTACARQD